MAHDDSTAEATVTAAAAAMLAQLQTTREGMAADFAEESALGSQAGIAGDETLNTDGSELGLYSDERQTPPRTRALPFHDPTTMPSSPVG